MANKDEITKKQHFIPRIYLKGFSSDEATVFGYRVTDKYEPSDNVSIKSICSIFDSCNVGVIRREWLGVTSANALTPAWAICYQC